MQFTKTAQELILETARKSPLRKSEYRRIDGMGAFYLAREDAPDEVGLETIMVVEIDAIQHKLCLQTDKSR